MKKIHISKIPLKLINNPYKLLVSDKRIRIETCVIVVQNVTLVSRKKPSTEAVIKITHNITINTRLQH